jgi:hypothetical protein
MTTIRTAIIVILALTLCYFSQACSMPVETSTEAPEQAAPESLSTCNVATAEANGDITQCSTSVLMVSTNPIVVTCPRAQGRPTVAQVGNFTLCEQGTSSRVWCCVVLPGVGQ